MMAMTSRPYAGERDYFQMRELLIAVYALTGAPVYATIGDLDWWRYPDDDPQAVETSQLWFDDRDVVVGFVWPGGKQADVVVHPTHQFLEDSMLAWAEERRRLEGRDEPTPLTLTTWGFDGDVERSATLQFRGYDRSDNALYFRFRNLDGSIPEPVLPDGYRISCMGERHIALRVEAHRQAFGSQRMTEARYLSVMRAPTYRPDLDIIVVAPDDTVASFGIVWHDSVNGHGSFEPVATHPDYQRLGLGKAVMFEGMRRLRARGARSASVLCGGNDIAANHLYASVGMELIDRNRAWTKAIEDATTG